jgi:hypothetical protein
MKQNKLSSHQIHVEEEDEDDEYDDFENDPEVWFDYLSEELATAYHILTDWVRSQGTPILENCTFPDFVDFVYEYSSGRKPIC